MPAVSRRLNGLYVILSSALASLCFTVLADGFWSALTPRFAAESGFAGVHILGMNQVADRLNGKAQARARTLYTGPFAIGSDLSYLAAGFLVGWSGWEAIFIAASIGSLLLIPIVTLIGPAAQGFRSAFSPAVLFWRRCASLAGVRQFNYRLVLDGVFWIARTGAPWRDLPKSLASWGLCTASSGVGPWQVSGKQSWRF